MAPAPRFEIHDSSLNKLTPSRHVVVAAPCLRTSGPRPAGASFARGLHIVATIQLLDLDVLAP